MKVADLAPRPEIVTADSFSVVLLKMNYIGPFFTDSVRDKSKLRFQ